jgi:hypothetical protein
VGKLAIDRTNSLGRLVRYASVYRYVVPSTLASYLIHVRAHVTRHTSWWAAIDMCHFVVLDTRRKEGFADRFQVRRVRTIPVPGGAVLSLFQIESQLCPGLESGTQRVPRHSSPYCPQNSAYADWFCPGGSVCSITPWKISFFIRHVISCEGDW